MTSADWSNHGLCLSPDGFASMPTLSGTTGKESLLASVGPEYYWILTTRISVCGRPDVSDGAELLLRKETVDYPTEKHFLNNS